MARWELAPLAPSDIDEILAIEKRAFKYPWSRHAVLDELACRQAFSHVVRVGPPAPNHPLIAYLCGRLAVQELHILKIAVAPGRRGQGLATWLLEACFRLARTRGALEAFLEVRPSNVAALNLYQKAGFDFIGRRPNYYPETGEDALLMMKPI